MSGRHRSQAIAWAFGPLSAAIFASALQAAEIAVHSERIESFSSREPERIRFGQLVFRGGLVLTAQAPQFGGLSGIWLDSSGARLIAATDRGNWLTADIDYEGDRPVGLSDARLEPILGPTGAPLAKTRQEDVEALAIAGGVAMIGLERTQQLMRFDFGDRNPIATVPGLKGALVRYPPTVRTVLARTRNAGVEALLLSQGDRAGQVIALSEETLNSDGNILGWIISGETAETFAIRPGEGAYALTDLAELGSGEAVLLERHFSFRRGLYVRLRLIALADIRAGAVVDGPILLEAGLGEQIDNFEAIAVHRAGDGTTVLTIVSDDNFSPIQRTLLLQFALSLQPAEPGAGSPAP